MLIKEAPRQVRQARLSELASGQPQAAHPDCLSVEPGADADGVTVHIPLPLLTCPPRWKRPGLVARSGAAPGLIIALIKSLRSRCAAICPSAKLRGSDFSAAASAGLPAAGFTGARTPADDRRDYRPRGWQWDQVPDHLKITFRVVDEKNKKLQEGRSLRDLKMR